jgi:glycosyltransferase involved in cell wall biosynthesis
MILGVPCVASSAGGVPSLLKDRHEGLLCPPDDVYGLAGAIAAIAADPALAARLGANARVRARQRHDARSIAQTTIAVYEDVVLHGHARRP